jgi:hypothetical protein
MVQEKGAPSLLCEAVRESKSDSGRSHWDQVEPERKKWVKTDWTGCKRRVNSWCTVHGATRQVASALQSKLALRKSTRAGLI